MRAYDLILKKRNGGRLSKDEIDWLVEGFTKGAVPDYQMAAFCMALWFKGMDDEETANLTLAMAASGDIVDLSSIEGFKVDKHSTGGVADTTTLVLGPLVAACGAKVAKMSGRGLGHTGGTIDKLESIPGFRTELPIEEFTGIVNEIGIAVVGQTANLAPADKRLYALRDTTATVDNISLIASSIMSKKLASGADGILLDVKTGRGAFMKGYEESKALATLMTVIGRLNGRRMEAAITDMDQPLGNAIGNSLEVVEAINCLSGKGPRRLEELCVKLGGRMLSMGGLVSDDSSGESRIKEALASGKGLEKFRQMIEAQGGDPSVIDDQNLLPKAADVIPVCSGRDGFITSMDSLSLGLAAVRLGAGRAKKDDPIDHAVGIAIEKRIGDRVDKGEALAYVYANDDALGRECVRDVMAAYTIGENPTEPPPLIYKFI